MSTINAISPADCIRQHPEMYWNGNPSPGFDDVNSAIAGQLRDDGCREIDISSKDGWNLTFCETNWAKTVYEKFGSIKRMFDEAVAVSGPTAGGLRVEWLVTEFASAVQVWVDGELVYSKGSTESAFDEYSVRELRGRVCIAYCLAD